MNHPCNQFSCPEYNQGQCFGGGCWTNPMPEPSAEDGESIKADTWYELRGGKVVEAKEGKTK